jgi:hypothetical protein
MYINKLHCIESKAWSDIRFWMLLNLFLFCPSLFRSTLSPVSVALKFLRFCSDFFSRTYTNDVFFHRPQTFSIFFFSILIFVPICNFFLFFCFLSHSLPPPLPSTPSAYLTFHPPLSFPVVSSVISISPTSFPTLHALSFLPFMCFQQLSFIFIRVPRQMLNRQHVGLNRSLVGDKSHTTM